MHNGESDVMSRLIAALISLLVISVAVLLIFFRGAEPNTLAFEVAKALIQLGIFAAIGALVSIATFEYQRLRQKQDSERELYRKNLESKEQLRRSVLARSMSAYRAVKKARRFLRAQAILDPVERPPMVTLQEYDRWLETVNDAQLDLEALVLDLGTSHQTFSAQEVVKKSLNSMESYLGEIVTEYEENRRKFDEASHTFLLHSLPKLGDFIAPSVGSGFTSSVKEPYERLHLSIRADLLGSAQ